MSWPIVKLGEVCEHEILRVRTLPVEVEEINYIDIGSVQGKRVSQYKRLRRAEAPGRAQQIVQEGDVILSTVRPNLNTLAMITNYKEDCPLVASTGFCVLRAKSVVLPRFLYDWLQNPDAVRELSALAEAKASYPSVTDGEVFSLALPLPSLPEQYDIVEELEWKLSRLEKIEGNFRAMAETAAQASRSVLTGTFRSLDAPIVKLGEVCETNPARTQHGDNEEVLFVPMASVREQFQNIAMPELRPWGKVKRGYTAFLKGDLLFAKITPCFQNGKAWIATGDGAGSTEFHVFRANPERLSVRYLFFFLAQDAVIKEGLKTLKGTAGQQRIAINYFSTLSLPLPSLPEQKRIVEELEWKLSRLEKVERLAREGLTVCEQARRAILAEAFRQADGADVRQDCSAAGQAEPSAQ